MGDERKDGARVVVRIGSDAEARRIDVAVKADPDVAWPKACPSDDFVSAVMAGIDPEGADVLDVDIVISAELPQGADLRSTCRQLSFVLTALGFFVENVPPLRRVGTDA